MRRTAPIAALTAFFLSAGAANATGAYLFDIIKEPAFHKAYVAMLTGATHLPSWLGEITGKGDYVATPETAASIDGVAYRLFHACKAHDCAGHEFEVMFDGAKAYGLLIDGNRPQRFFGQPNPQQQAALQKAIAD